MHQKHPPAKVALDVGPAARFAPVVWAKAVVTESASRQASNRKIIIFPLGGAIKFKAVIGPGHGPRAAPPRPAQQGYSAGIRVIQRFKWVPARVLPRSSRACRRTGTAYSGVSFEYSSTSNQAPGSTQPGSAAHRTPTFFLAATWRQRAQPILQPARPCAPTRSNLPARKAGSPVPHHNRWR